MTNTTERELRVRITETPMVNWFNPAQLIPIAVRSLLGTLFGSYTDRREVEAALSPDAALADAVRLDFSQRDEIWLDYVADLGDGWNATSSVASLLSQERLQIGDTALPRAEVLVMGGDQVYPDASRDAYLQRFVTPYQAALPWSDEGRAPLLLAMPGNHDWYDGLTSFLRVFCQRRWIGGRVTAQSRSYFALRLPHRWWLWAVDIQLQADIDGPQKDYFAYFASQLAPGDRVILCLPKPEWVERGDARCVGQHKPAYLDCLEKLVTRQGARFDLYLAGDSHHYARYAPTGDDKPQRITCGGGGAFLHGTQELAAALSLPEPDGRTQTYALKAAYPDVARSRSMHWRNLVFWAFNPAFSLLLASVYLLLAWLWHNASGGLGPLDAEPWRMITAHPLTALLSLVLPVGMLLFASAPPRRRAGLRRLVWGSLHGLAHMAVAVFLWHLATRLPLDPLYATRDALLTLALLLPLGIVLGGSLFGAYLSLSSAFSGMHENEVYSSLRNQDCKSFVRLHLSADGLVIHPLRLARSARRWAPAPGVQTDARPGWLTRLVGTRHWEIRVPESRREPWFVPDQPLQAEALEAPVRVS